MKKELIWIAVIAVIVLVMATLISAGEIYASTFLTLLSAALYGGWVNSNEDYEEEDY